MPRLIYHGWLHRESLLRDNRSHAPVEVRNKCLDLSRIYIAEIGNSVPPLLAYAVGMQVREHLECNITYQIKCQNWQNCLFLPISCNFKNLFVFVNEILSLSGLSKISKERSPPRLAKRKQNLLLACRSGEIINDYFNRELCASLWARRPPNRGNPQELIDGYGLPPQQILCEAIADYHARIKSQEKEQSQEETAELEVLYTGIWLLKMKLGSSFLQNNSSDLKDCCPRKYYL